MIDADRWIAELTAKLIERFADRLLFVGLQGSYQRGEAHAESDIDVVVLLNTLSPDDLAAYRTIVMAMPEPEKACGFICGREELANWPKHELFQFEKDTRPCYGILGNLLPPVEYRDVAESVKISVSGLFHACCHAMVYEPLNTEILKGLYKASFFLLQTVHCLRTGEYIHTAQGLLPRLEGDEAAILSLRMHWDERSKQIEADPSPYFNLLFRWTKDILDTRFPECGVLPE